MYAAKWHFQLDSTFLNISHRDQYLHYSLAINCGHQSCKRYKILDKNANLMARVFTIDMTIKIEIYIMNSALILKFWLK